MKEIYESEYTMRCLCALQYTGLRKMRKSIMNLDIKHTPDNHKRYAKILDILNTLMDELTLED